jgi:cation:H+ antiporter
MNIPPIVIGLTVVAMGTSMPEFFISFISALKGTTDLAVGNVVGSNIFNAMLIVGTAALVAPMTILKSTVKKDIPFAILASAMLIPMTLDGNISRLDAALLFVVFIAFMVYTVRSAKNGKSQDEAEAKQMPVWQAIAFFILGLACLIVGSNLFVDGATEVASLLGVSEAVIGLTIVAGGTSLPELATSVVAARKGQSAIAMGNVIGSNVMNILMILGVTGLIHPMAIQGITWLDLSVMLVSVLLLWLFSFTKYTVARWEGAVLVILFLGYMTWLVMQAI